MAIARAGAIGLVVAALATPGLAAEEMAVFSYEGGMWGRRVEVHLDADGTGSVRGSRGRAPAYRGTFQLSDEERADYLSMMRKADFLGRTVPDDVPAPPDVGTKRLRLALDGRTRDLKWAWVKEFQPVENWFLRLDHQVYLCTHLDEKGVLYEVRSALFPEYSAMKALQPRAFRDPLREFVGRTTDQDQAVAALAILARLDDASPWAAVATMRMDESAPGTRLRIPWELLTPESGVPETHQRALAPAALRAVELRAKSWAEVEGRERDHFRGVLGDLGRLGHRPMLSSLARMVREVSTVERPLVPSALSWFGDEGLGEVLGLLDDPSAGARHAAVRSLQAFLYRKGISTPPPGLTPEGRERILERLRREAVPRLEALRDREDEPFAIRDISKSVIRWIREEPKR
jgi:hypothetical protein